MGPDNWRKVGITQVDSHRMAGSQREQSESVHSSVVPSARSTEMFVDTESADTEFTELVDAKKESMHHVNSLGQVNQLGGAVLDNADFAYVGYDRHDSYKSYRSYDTHGSNGGLEPENVERREATVHLGGKSYSVVTTLTQQQLEQNSMLVESRARQIGGRRGVTHESVMMAAVALANELNTQKARAQWLGNKLEEVALARQSAERDLAKEHEQLVTAQRELQKMQDDNCGLRSRLERMKAVLTDILCRIDRVLKDS